MFTAVAVPSKCVEPDKLATITLTDLVSISLMVAVVLSAWDRTFDYMFDLLCLEFTADGGGYGFPSILSIRCSQT